jgi:glycerol-3-phosphate dehydrogenase
MSSYDVIVIGGGINGVGIARESALQGFKTLLLEKDDICSGVSAWSGRLAHGGLRYLEHYDFALVRESLLERERLIKNAPHLAKHVSWLMPVYRHNKRPVWLVELGMLLFDILSFDKSAPWHRYLSKKKTIARFPDIDQNGLQGGFQYWDGQIELAERLCVEISIDAIKNGAEIRTHAQVSAPIFENSRVVGVKYKDLLTGEELEATAPVIYNVAGPWIDRVFNESAGVATQPRLNGGTKGSHFIVDPFEGAPSDVIYYETRVDGRLILVVPWFGKYLIGTTDIRWETDPGDARCDIGELEYLLNEVNALIPQAKLTRNDVLYTYSGVRPLPYEPGKPESSVTRTHILYDHAKTGLPGLVTVVGGKLTTYRQLAEDAVVDIAKRLGKGRIKSKTRKSLLPGAHFSSLEQISRQLLAGGVLPPVAERITRLYGSRALNLWLITRSDPSAGLVLDSGLGITKAEILFVLREEFPKTLSDVMARRMILAFEKGHGLHLVDSIADIVGGELGWSSEERRRQIAGYREWLNHLAIPDESGPRSTSFGAGITVEAK